MRSREDGFITLEASISVTIFLLLMYFLSSYFISFAAQSTTAHVILESTESLSIDAYRITKVGDKPSDKIDSVQTFIKSRIFDATSKVGYDTTNDNWFTQDTTSHQARMDYINNAFIRDKEYKSPLVENMVKNRFIFFLTGGDELKADTMLKEFKIKDGLDGLDFSDSYIKDGELYASVKYEIESDFKSVGVNNINIEQTSRSKLWTGK